MQVELDPVAQQQERIQPDMRLAIGARRDEPAEFLFGDKIAQHVIGYVGVVIVENHAPHSSEATWHQTGPACVKCADTCATDQETTKVRFSRATLRPPGTTSR